MLSLNMLWKLLIFLFLKGEIETEWLIIINMSEVIMVNSESGI